MSTRRLTFGFELPRFDGLAAAVLMACSPVESGWCGERLELISLGSSSGTVRLGALV